MSKSPLERRLDRKAAQSKAYHASSKLERKMALRVNGRTTSGSGNKFEKGDVRRVGVLRLEHKATQAKSFRVTLKDLEKLELAARGCDEIPIFTVDFLDERGNSQCRELAVVPLQDILDLINGAS